MKKTDRFQFIAGACYEKVFIFALVVALVAVSLLFAACPGSAPETKEPLTTADCFRGIYRTTRFRILYANTDYPKVEELPLSFVDDHGSLDAILSAESVMKSDLYSKFFIFTTEKAARISVSKITFEVVTVADCIVQFALAFGEDDVHYAEGAVVVGGTPATITFDNLHKSWSEKDVGNNEIKDMPSGGQLILGESGSYITVSLENPLDFIGNSYFIRNLQIEFTEF